MKSNRGRPPNPPELVKSKPVQIRMNEREKEAFAKAAQLAGLSLSSWIRERMRAAARKELDKAGEPVAFL